MNAMIAAAALLAAPAHAAPAWLFHEFEAPAATGYPTDDIERFLNDECRPSGMDGVQMLAVQKGNGDHQFLHLYCRPDGARARYRVTAASFALGHFDDLAKQQAARPETRIGPFFFGAPGANDAFLVIERVSAGPRRRPR